MLKKASKKIVMEKHDNTNFSWVSFHDNYDDDDDEALSLCANNQQFSLSNSPDKDRNEKDDVLRINTTITAHVFDEELFEFFSDFNSGMKAAEDIIYCGKLLPYSSPESKNQSNQPRRVSIVDEFEQEEQRFIESNINRKRLFPHRKCSSLNELQKSQPKRTLHKNYSLEYQKLQRSSGSKNTSAATASRAYDYDGNKCFRKNVLSSTPSLSIKSKKQVALFGVMKAPAEMELTDIKYRQNKRNSLVSLTTVHPGEKTIYAKNNGRKNSWSVLGALGCKGHANAVVTISLRCLPHV